MEKTGLKYNTEKEQIIISEYGRCVQEMIHKLPEIEDRKERTEAAQFIVSVMAQMTPQVKESDDYQHKLWDLLYIISDYQLDVDGPYEPPIRKGQETRPKHIDYQNNEISYGHYGQYLVKMIEAASKEENEEVREALALSLACKMKHNYLDWNKSIVNDQVIIEDLKRISGGKLVLADDTKLSLTADSNIKAQSQTKQQQAKKKKKKVPNLKANMNNPNNPAYKKRLKQ
ncbi:MAG: DUF4290 domain-containing protein [Bacteroidales bacterium]|jgi:ribosomal protein S30|nr:DUF4290 domain-containing protein [Bacteroidales bacterium]MBR3427497.1 DUF4290 domain-containing protein [Bacteroidales bacterium]